MKQIHSIHFTGIKGVGMTPLAVIAKEAGMRVTGSDVADIYITDEILKKAGIPVYEGFSTKHIKDVDLVIATGAHGGYSNQEVIFAKEKGISVMMQGTAVGYFMSGEPFGRQDMEGISIAGCHGKTTTTAMIATVLQSAGKDPSFVIGTGFVPSLGSSGHYGKGQYFVAEADEYATEPMQDKTTKFLWQHPKIAVITNIEYDHPDLYPTFASLVAAYKQFIEQTLENGGCIIACGDDPEIQKVYNDTKSNITTYGLGEHNDYALSDIEPVVGGTSFTLTKRGGVKEVYMLSVLGLHNVLNAGAAIVVGREAGLSIDEIKKGLLAFTGTKRRLEFVGNTKKGAAVFDDYAHHPTEIQKTLATLRERYKDSTILCIFQPHTFSRTKLLFKEFCASFTDADQVIFTDIYASQREPFDNTISSKHLADKTPNAIYLPTLSDVLHYVQEKQADSRTIIVTMGAGDVYKIAYEVVK